MKHIKLFESYNDELDDDKMAWTKHFDILSIKYSVGGDDFRLITPDHPEFNDCIQDCVESEWRKDEIEIYSVRRKQDGEIFTLGQPVYNVSLDIKNFGIADKFWPSFSQIRVDIGNGGFPLNHLFFKSSTILDMIKKGIVTSISDMPTFNEGVIQLGDTPKKLEIGDWLDVIKKYQSLTPNTSEINTIKSVAIECGANKLTLDDTNVAGTRSISIITEKIHVIIWKLEDEYWTVYTSSPPNIETRWLCDQMDELIQLLKNLLSKK